MSCRQERNSAYHSSVTNCITTLPISGITVVARWSSTLTKSNKCFDRPYSYSLYWTGTSLQLRLMRRIFSNANDLDLFFMIFPHMNLHCKLGPVDCREYEYLNNRVSLSRNYRLIVAPRKFDVLKTNICPRSEASSANILVLRTLNFQGATIRSIIPRHKHSIVFIVHH